MNRHTIIKAITAFLAAALAISCNKSEPSATDDGEIQIIVDDTFEATVDTKATAVTSIPSSLYWGATTGGNAAGNTNETAKWSAASATVSSSKISTGKYQTYSPTTYNFYVSNVNFTVGAATSITVSGNGTDIIAGRGAQTNSTTPSVTLNHIFARTGTLTMNTQTGYTITVDSWSIIGKSDINGTAGTYNMRTGAWSSASTKLTSATAISSSSDMYLIPGTYTLSCTYTLTKGDWSHQFTKSADVTIVGGKVNNITGTASGGSASEIVLSLSLTAWGTENLSPTFS